MIVIVDYGMGNLGSVQNMFKKVGADCRISSEIAEIDRADKILLPGVGAFDVAMKKIADAGMLEILNKKALEEKIPIMGICLGMQLLTNGSEEGKLPGLGWIPGYARHFKERIESHLRVPHMGWNTVKLQQRSAILGGFEQEEEIRYYFVHSYFVCVDDEHNSLMKTSYGIEFDSAIIKDNIIGAQFHPEKSHRFGMKLFKNFAAL
ncbi:MULTISPECIES: imidazole glycerol phosphate synthase subunit HisH [Olivibacter]|uniref:Imidazole glycerol phosphate synthase subunit HisH n=1 Tax=Olivibacter jilunii TaxID=985016 RepID=A0ABW6B7K2_9SPHI|nr:imidazole glycerol phosphate synthase subunit HisH [Olivibacter sp. UJ_SKK_5.1]MDX3912654.1 imidazole glycerol phosphate synthase subunit HisH [Pseudosphingobacterium sp.]